MKAYVSIHDLMPETMDRVETILRWLEERNVPPVSLLVVPGKPWTSDQIGRIREMASNGHELIAHGWHHHTNPKRLKHRIHALLISRNVAEHLDMDSGEILELLNRSHHWFAENDLPTPSTYVPPAWALGTLSKTDLANAPFSTIETTRGFLHRNDSQFFFQYLPLTGYEADTQLRESFLLRWNYYQEKRALKKNLCLRVSIHPKDLELRLAYQLDGQVRRITEFRKSSDLSIKDVDEGMKDTI